MKDSGFNKGIADATEKGESFGTKFGSVVADIAKAAAVGLGAAATAFGGLTVKALQLGGDLEQNLGGSEAVFKEFADTIQNVGATAFETMGLSASDFLATANKMGALMQGSGIDIETSMDLSAKAMQRAADVASIMGIDTSAAMESIAGAAKGNFTMMDNLGVAMNATTIEAYALEKGIKTSWKEMDNATKVTLAMEMFLEKTTYAAGNYAKENETLSGSLGTAKAALSNFLSGAGDIESVIKSATNLSGVVAKNLAELLPRLAEGLPGIFTALAPMIPPLFDTLIPAVAEGAVKLVTGFADGIVNNLPMILSTGKNVIQTLLDGIFGENEQINTAFNAIWDAFDNVMTAITESGLIQNIIELLSKIGEKALEITPFIADIFSDTLVGIIDGVSSAIGFLVDNFEALEPVVVAVFAGFVAYKTVTGIMQAVTAAQLLLNAAMNANPIGIVVAAIAALVAGIVYLWNTNEGFRTALLTGWAHILNFFDGVPLFFQKVGTGIADAFSYAKVFVLEIMQKMANGIIDTVNVGIKALNFLPGVSIKVLEQVSFATEAAIEEAEIRAKRADELTRKTLENAEKAAQRLDELKKSAMETGEDTGEGYINSLAASMISNESTVAKANDTVRKSLLDGLDAYSDAGKTIANKYVDGLSSALESGKSKVSESAKNLTSSINEGFQTETVDINQAISDLVKLINTLGSSSSSMMANAIRFGEGLSYMGKELAHFAMFYGQRVAHITESFSNLGKGLNETASGIKNIVETIGSSIIEAVNDVDNIFNTFASNIEDVARQSMEGFKKGIVGTGREIFGELGNSIRSVERIYEEFLSSFFNFSAKTETIGKQAMTGFRNGFVDTAKGIFLEINSMFKGFINDIRNVFGIRSPSKEFAWIGKMNMEGFAEGIEGMKRRVDGAVDSVFGDLGGNVDYGINFNTRGYSGGIGNGSYISRPISNFAQAVPTGTRTSAESTTPTVIQHISLNVNVDEVDDIVKLTQVFQNFAFNNTATQGV